MAQGAEGVIETRDPVIFHAARGKLEVLRFTLVVLRAVDELDDIVDLAAGFRI